MQSSFLVMKFISGICIDHNTSTEWLYEFFKVFINGRHFYGIFYFEGFKRLYHQSIGVWICSIVVYAYYEFHVYFAKKRDVQTLTEVSKEIWWHISAITCQINMSTCQIIMSTCQIFMFTCQIIMSTCQKIIITTNRLISCFHNVFMPLTAIYLSVLYLTSRHNFLTSRQNN